MRTLFTRRGPLGLLATGALVTGLLTTPLMAPQAAAAPGDPLLWGPCPKSAGIDASAGAQCALFKAPMDYKKPHGKKITIMMSRFKATGPSKGVIFANPGGPGGHALNMWTSLIARGPGKDLLKSFDLVAVQPRGLVNSTPLAPCPELKWDATSEEKKANSKCLTEYNEYFKTVHTENTARDFDLARTFLGQEKIHYFGGSYGTYLGAVYLSLFPQHTGRFVLDSAVDPDRVWFDAFSLQGKWQRKRMYEMFEFFAAHDDIYHLGDTPLKAYTSWYRVIEKEMSGPLTPRLTPPPAQVGDVPPIFTEMAEQYLQVHNTLTPAAARFERMIKAWTMPPTASVQHNLWELTGLAFTSRALWPKVAHYIKHPNPQKLTPEEEQEELYSVQTFLAVTCNENAIPAQLWKVPLIVTDVATGADWFDIKDRAVSSGVQCLTFPASTKPVPVANKGLAVRPVVLQSVNDTQTPYIQGPAMAKKVNAYFIKADGGDHGVYVRHNPKAWKAINDYYYGAPITISHVPYATIPQMVYTPKK